MIREALDFPTSGDHGSWALLVGSLLLLLAGVAVAGAGYASDAGRPSATVAAGLSAVVSLVAVRGYYYRSLAAAATRPDPVAPSFGGVRRLFSEAAVAIGIAVLYALPAGLLLGSATGMWLLADRGGRTVELLAQALGAVAALFGIVALVAALYLTPAALAAVARAGDLPAALEVRRVIDSAATEDYVVGWVLATALQWTLVPISALLSTVVVGSVLYFLIAVATRYVFGASFRAAVGGDDGVPRIGIAPSNRGRSEAELQEMVLNADVSRPDAESVSDAREVESAEKPR